MTKQRTIWPARWIHGCPGFLQVTLDNFAVSIMIRRVTDQEKFEGWLSGQTCDLRGETGFCSCLLTLAEGEDRLSKLPFHKHTHTHTHTHTDIDAHPLHSISISFSTKHEIKAIYNLADNYIIRIHHN